MGGYVLLSAWQCGVTVTCQEQICLSQYMLIRSLVRQLCDNSSSDYGLVQMWHRRKGNPRE